MLLSDCSEVNSFQETYIDIQIQVPFYLVNRWYKTTSYNLATTYATKLALLTNSFVRLIKE